MQFNGEGIQHIALICDNLLEVVDKLGMAGVPLATAPNDVYYEMLDTRLPGHGQPVPELQSRGILLDGTTADGTPRLLLQIFSTPMLGPVFFEFIQREGDYRDGFGEGQLQGAVRVAGARPDPPWRACRRQGLTPNGGTMAVEPVVYGASERPPRGDYARAGADYTCAQNYAAYTEGRPRHLPAPVRGARVSCCRAWQARRSSTPCPPGRARPDPALR